MPYRPKRFYVYILSSRSRNLYVGVTSDLMGRVSQHKDGHGSGFTSRYKIDRLVYLEEFASCVEAIAREKQIKAWTRAKRVALTESANPSWQDLAQEEGVATKRGR
jgi:putative endonuclease